MVFSKCLPLLARLFVFLSVLLTQEQCVLSSTAGHHRILVLIPLWILPAPLSAPSIWCRSSSLRRQRFEATYWQKSHASSVLIMRLPWRRLNYICIYSCSPRRATCVLLEELGAGWNCSGNSNTGAPTWCRAEGKLSHRQQSRRHGRSNKKGSCLSAEDEEPGRSKHTFVGEAGAKDQRSRMETTDLFILVVVVSILSTHILLLPKILIISTCVCGWNVFCRNCVL